jgi:hypothetical protein
MLSVCLGEAKPTKENNHASAYGQLLFPMAHGLHLTDQLDKNNHLPKLSGLECGELRLVNVRLADIAHKCDADHLCIANPIIGDIFSNCRECAKMVHDNELL